MLRSPTEFILASSDETTNILETLDDLLLDDQGRIKLLPHSFYQDINYQYLRIWCSYRARYGIPTVELVEWLKACIGDRSAIEIGAGNGDLGYHLGIPMTDSYDQRSPQIERQMLAMGQAPTDPADDVEKLEALAAVTKYQPEVVVASWVTERTSGFYGVEESKLISKVKYYIHVGNAAIHGSKKALKLPHSKHKIPLISRAKYPEENIIYLWSDL